MVRPPALQAAPEIDDDDTEEIPRPEVVMPDLSCEELAERFEDPDLIEISMKWVRSIMPGYLRDNLADNRVVDIRYSQTE